MLHGCQFAFTCPPVSVCIVCRVSILVRDGDYYFPAGALAEFDVAFKGGVEVPHAGGGDGVDGGVEFFRGNRGWGGGARDRGGGDGGQG